MIKSLLLAAGEHGLFDSLKHAVNAVTKPAPFMLIAMAVFALMFVFYKWWTKPAVFAAIFGLFILGYFGSMGDDNFRSIVAKPDNVPITIMVISVMLCIWVAFRRAALNDSRVAAGLPLLEEDRDDRVLVWPDLVYTELICLIIGTAGLILWAVVSKAPLEQPANPGYAPNPAKAPWYFLGLQEMLVYFDPWMAGVVLPTFIIVGLMAMPYIDYNTRVHRNTGIGNLLNLCAVSVPCGITAAGLPIGLMIYAKPFAEDMALRVGYAYEQATEWHTRRPDLSWIERSAGARNG